MRLLVKDIWGVRICPLVRRCKPERARYWNTGKSVLWVIHQTKKGKVVADVYWWNLSWRTILSKVVSDTNIFQLFYSVQQ